MSITTRRAGDADPELLHDLAERTFGLACPPGTRQEDIDAFIATNLSVASFRGYLADPERILLLVLRDGVPVGYSMLVGGPIKDPDVSAVIDERVSIELSKCYVAPDQHGSGAAAALMTDTLTAAGATGAAFCWLGVNQQNVRAAKFYAKNGFEIVGTKRFLVGSEWHNDHIRRRPLP
ncbi:N-acetyltransferase [Paractinoplanes abujensis]|uniref:Ribosomal protein S18 acetylase RimI-like enzyme n=1 Tax=Paractinoplanes abujensis TaxID=882441 RepID=A0A7W7CUG1_9ACTN|nr:GNAT family N-acetyltransferase [Actinoplanes abujensis]MBB4694904.1 ribosomal protein S18 acetylase RimI-like enzyme [Actinoplanes abujensis]GID23633.1 N-acetyltransferase [Actinoplanes abujensis]